MDKKECEFYKCDEELHSVKHEFLSSNGEITNADSQGSSEKNLATNKSRLNGNEGRFERNKLIDSLLDADSNKIRAPASLDQSIPSIYRIPEKIKLGTEKSVYSPRVISIGPLYKHDEHLKSMEVHKKNYMHCLFKRTRAPSLENVEKQMMTECVDAMLKTVVRARTCYAPSFPQYSDIEFAEMMIIDSCFILELLYRFHQSQRKEIGDPILGNSLVHLDVAHDLLLLENQIPFFVLETLFELTSKQIENLLLLTLIPEFFGNILNMCELKREEPDMRPIEHILDFLHRYFLPSPTVPKEGSFYPRTDNFSASDLRRAGVTIMACEKDSVVDVEFNTSCWFNWLCRKRTPSEIPTFFVFKPNSSWFFVSWLGQLFGKTRLAITPLCIGDNTESFLRNLIAFEQCYPYAGYHISSYAYIMDKLINTERDVQLLEKKGVLRNDLGDNKEAADLFNNLCREIVVENFSFGKQWNQVKKYRRLYCPRHIASLKRRYSWSGIAFIVGLFLTVCQIIQTIKAFRSG